MTGLFPGPFAGRNTFRNRQSSDVLASPNGDADCGQCGANEVAGRVPDQGAAGCGGAQRSAPAGGAAYGMPRNSSVAPATLPWTRPVLVTASGPPLVPCAAVPPPIAAAVEHAASVPAARMIAAIRALGRPLVPSARIGGLLSAGSSRCPVLPCSRAENP